MSFAPGFANELMKNQSVKFGSERRSAIRHYGDGDPAISNAAAWAISPLAADVRHARRLWRTLSEMNHPQHIIEKALGYPIAWDDTAAWLQAVGTILAIGLAILLDVLARRRARLDSAAELAQRRAERGHRETRA